MLCSDAVGLGLRLTYCCVRISVKLRVGLVSGFRIGISFGIGLEVTSQPRSHNSSVLISCANRSLLLLSILRLQITSFSLPRICGV